MRANRMIVASLASALMVVLVPATAGAAGLRLLRAPLARPTDHPDPARRSYTVPEAPQSPACTAHFCVHWVAEGLDAPSLVDANGIEDGDGIPDFVERVERVAEHVRSIENGRLGWRDPLSDGTRGGGNAKTDVYLENLGRSLFGYAAPDPGQEMRAHGLPRRLHSYLVLDNDYSAAEYPGTGQLSDLEVTFAHEYNHVLQLGYDAYEDPWFSESTAVWMEDQVYGHLDDYLRYIRRWVRLFDTPLTASSIKEYGSAVWNEWLAHRYGGEIVREAWARAARTKPGGFAVSAYQSAISAAGGSEFSEEFARFARDVAEWRTGEVFRRGPIYPDVPRHGSLPADGRPLKRFLNHTTFQLLRVHARADRAVVVQAVAPSGVAAGLALVGRIGSERHGRAVTRLRYAPHGGTMTVRLDHPRRFARLTAVLVNADVREDGFDARRLDWSYLTETVPFRIRVVVR